MARPEIAILVSSFERPDHLFRSLLSIALQRDVAGLIEVVVTDDGSSAMNRRVAEAFACGVDFPVRFTTHAHDGFRLSRCRNEGAAVSTAPYLLFTDGDCLLPPDHVRRHLDFRRPGRVVVGDCYRLDREATQRVTEEVIHNGAYMKLISPRQRRRLAGKAFRAWCYHLLRCAMLPRMTGNNIGLWRTDYERVNGFDENYVGWGLEDRDLQRRLGRLGLRFKSILGRTAVIHLWHAPAPTFARNNVGTKNLEYYRRAGVATRCRNGLAERVRESDWYLRDEFVLIGAPAKSAVEADPWEQDENTPQLLPFPAAAERCGPSRKAA